MHECSQLHVSGIVVDHNDPAKGEINQDDGFVWQALTPLSRNQSGLSHPATGKAATTSGRKTKLGMKPSRGSGSAAARGDRRWAVGGGGGSGGGGSRVRGVGRLQSSRERRVPPDYRSVRAAAVPWREER